MSNRPPSAATLRRLERASGALATQAVARMDDELDWFRAMPADQRSWVTLVAQAGIASLVEWCRNPGKPPRLTGEVFGAAPRELVRAVALKQTVDLIKVTVEVLEDHVRSVAEPGDEDALHLAVLPVQPRGRLRHRARLRQLRREPRCLGRPARGAGRRRPPPR